MEGFFLQKGRLAHAVLCRRQPAAQGILHTGWQVVSHVVFFPAFPSCSLPLNSLFSQPTVFKVYFSVKENKRLPCFLTCTALETSFFSFYLIIDNP